MIVSPDEIQRLSFSERIALIEALWQSIAAAPDPPDLTDEQRQELTRRRNRRTHDQSMQTSPGDPDYQPGHYAVTKFKHRSMADEAQLIEKHIDLDYDQYPYRRADAWLRESHVS